MNLELWHIVFTAIVLLFLGGLVGRWIAIFWSVVKASRIASRGVSTLLEEAAEQMIADPPQRWVVECLHLLKALDVRVDGQEYQTALAQIQADIRVRVETGRWPSHQVQVDAEQGAER
jgi:hypothetical protein